MKRTFAFLLLWATSIVCKAESCDPPPVAIEFMQADYVFYGTTGKMTLNKDSSFYKIEVNVYHHFKRTPTQPKSLTFTFPTEVIPEFKHIPASKRSHRPNVSLLIFAHQTPTGLQFSESCSNTEYFPAFQAIRKDLLHKLETGNDVELDSVVFHSRTTWYFSSQMKKPIPKGNLDSLLSPSKENAYGVYGKGYYENFILHISETGALEKVVSVKNVRHTVKRYYDIYWSVFPPLPTIPTPLQHDVMKALYRYKQWIPATFMGKPVKYQAIFQVYFDKENKIQPSIFD
ncbi:hypothetical protein [Rufibacter sp. XAAS-G3-1]|uniref:hypothetical protein n=1 Tax=Rufibacter sp. XAAS-G3-1 TaxID=2729134 RepID=UPI0015E6F650|nr:hypothetical protein [Rufibacter sp. XAAS-G3-1]